MKNFLRSLLPFLALIAFNPSAHSACHAGFEWNQIDGTLNVHFTNTSTSDQDITSYQWNFGDGHSGDGQNPTHEYDEPGVYLVCLIITNAVGCVSDVCHEVVVEAVSSECNAQFEWNQIEGTLNIHFTNTSTSDHDITSYQWNFGDGHSGDGQNPTHEYDEPGVYVVCLIITNAVGCVSDVCHEVVVEEISSECHAQFEWNQIEGTLNIHFTNTSTSDHDIISYQWNFGDGHSGDGQNPTHEYDEPGVYVVCLIITNAVGCVSDVCHEVVVEEISSECHAQFEWNQIAGTLNIHFTNTSTSDHDIISYQWNFGDGHSGDGQNPTHEYDEPGVYVVCLIITNAVGCVSDVCHEVIVEAVQSECHAQFEWVQIEGTYNIHFINHSTSNHDIISYFWTFGDGHSGDGQNPTHEYDAPGVYLVCLRIEDNTGCVSEICHEVTVHEIESACHAQFEWEQIDSTFSIHFINQSTSENEIISYHWTFGDGHSSDDANPTHAYEHAGNYVVCLRIEDNTGCVSEVCHEVTVHEIEAGCHAQFEWVQIEGTYNIHFINHSTSDHDIISYLWTFGDGHSGDGHNPTHEYDAPGVYVVCLRIEDNTGCVSEICHEVTVHEIEPGCHAAFEWVQIEGTYNIHFINHSTSNHDIISYLWTFGDGHSGDGQNPTHEYDAPGVYVVCLRIEDNTGCVSEICHEVTITGPEGCEAGFNFEVDDNDLVHFNNTSTGATDSTTWLWHFGDGETSTEENPIHDYAEPGIYTICLTMVDDSTDCNDEFCLTFVYQLGWEDLHQDAVPGDSKHKDNIAAAINEDFIIHSYTNPVSENLFINYEIKKESTVRFEIYDLTGHRMVTKTINGQITGAQQEILAVGFIPPGLYILTMTTGESINTMRISISR